MRPYFAAGLLTVDLSTFPHELLDTGGELVMEQEPGEH